MMVKHEESDIKVIRKGGDKFFCRMDVDPSGDLISQGCRLATDEPDVIL